MNISDKTKNVFYNSLKWKKLRAYKLAVQQTCQCPVCEYNDLETDADQVHHIIDIDIDWSLRLDYYNLMSVNHICHSRITMTNNQLKKKDEAPKYDDTTNRLIGIALGGGKINI